MENADFVNLDADAYDLHNIFKNIHIETRDIEAREKYISLFKCDEFIIANFLLDKFFRYRKIYFIK